MKLYRLLAIIMYLLNRDKVTATELAEYFEVSVRTIYRDLETINEAGIPIVSYQGANGGYSILDSYIMDRQVLTNEEIISIIAALQGLGHTVNDTKFNDIAEKIEVLSATTKHNTAENGASKSNGFANNVSQKYYFDFSPWGLSQEHQKKFKLLEKAIDNCQMLHFTYTNLKGDTGERTIEPMTLVLRSTSWYVYAYCKLREDYRLFKVHRMRKVQLLAETFTRKGLEYKDNLLHEKWEEQSKTVDLVLRFSPLATAKAQEYFSDDQIEVIADGHFIVNATYPQDEWVYSFILGFGALVEVLEPQYVRQKIQEQAKKIYGIYN